MTESRNVVPGAEHLYLHIGDNSGSLRCSDHPELGEAYPLDVQRNLRAAWIVGVVARHLKDHAAESAAPVATAGPQLDPFAREVAKHCRWAIDHHRGDPLDDWPLDIQLAVALVLFNIDYLADIGPGPGYTAETAMLRLFSGEHRPPADPMAWFAGIRDAIAPGVHPDNRGPWTSLAARRSNTVRDSS
ncbi:hypothetical protein ACQPZJ_14215 [Actinoplanes sp. CA-054009]